MSIERIIRSGRRAALAALAALSTATIVACGGAGAGAGGGGLGGGANGVADIVVLTDTPTLPAADGSTTAVVTAQVKDANNNIVRNQPVSFSTTDAGVSLTPLSANGLTDTAGRAQVRVELGAGAAARRNRAVTVNATAGSLSRTASIAIVGTRISITGPDSLTAGGTAEYTIAATDGANAGIGSMPLTVAFSGGTPASSSVTTGTNGQARVTLSGVTPGAATITVSGTGIDAVTRNVQVLGANAPFRFLSPNDGAEVAVSFAQPVQVLLLQNGVAVAGRPVTVASTRGTVNGSTQPVVVTTNASGVATVNVQSASAGAATVTAIGDPGTGTATSISTRLVFASRSPASVSLSPSPSSISANAPGSSASTSRLVATVRDAGDNPVTGATVVFSANDPSGGRIEPSIAVTDAQGQAVSSFVAGQTSTGQNAVNVTATVLNAGGTPVASSVQQLTVSAVALFVELGTGNVVEALDTITYRHPWRATVTDANRNPVVGVPVTASLVSIRYYKGIWDGSGDAWVPASFDNPTLPPIACTNEDANGNNLLDAGEDVNSSGRLEPGSPASVQNLSTEGKTGEDGLVQLGVVYPRSFGGWVDVTLQVTIGTSGTQSSARRTFRLPLLAEDVNDTDKAPPNVGNRTPNSATPPNQLTGPFGYVQSCTDPN